MTLVVKTPACEFLSQVSLQNSRFSRPTKDGLDIGSVALRGGSASDAREPARLSFPAGGVSFSWSSIRAEPRAQVCGPRLHDLPDPEGHCRVGSWRYLEF